MNWLILMEMSWRNPEIGSILRSIMPMLLPNIFLVVDIVYIYGYISIGFIVISVFLIFFGRYQWMTWYI